MQPCGQMHEQIAGMHKIERCFGKGVADRIMPADLDAITCEPLQQAHVKVERNDQAVSHPRRKQPRRGAGASAHVKTTPALANSDRIELPDRKRIVNLLKEREPRTLELLGPVLAERVSSWPG